MKSNTTVGKKKKRIVGDAICERELVDFALTAGKLAFEAAIAEKASVTFAKNGRVYTLNPDGTEVIGAEIPKEVHIPLSKRKIILR